MRLQNNQQGFLLGIDTGTSKTHALVSDLQGIVIGIGEAGCGNYEVVGMDGFIASMNSAIMDALKNAQITKRDLVAMGFGISGYDWPSERPDMIDAIDALGIPGPYQFVNDAVIGLIAGSSEGWGIAVDAGTGNNVRGRDRSGRSGRITGNSAKFGEFGGAGELVSLGIIAVTYAWSQRGPQTRMTQLFMDFADVTTGDALIEGLAMDQIHLPPILAMQIIKLAEEGDPAAREVVTFSARELALNVIAVIRQLDLQDLDFDVVLIGSVFKAGEIYQQPFKETVHEFAPGARMVQLTIPPVAGALLLAAETVERRNQDFRENLINSIGRVKGNC